MSLMYILLILEAQPVLCKLKAFGGGARGKKNG